MNEQLALEPLTVRDIYGDTLRLNHRDEALGEGEVWFEADEEGTEVLLCFGPEALQAIYGYLTALKAAKYF